MTYLAGELIPASTIPPIFIELTIRKSRQFRKSITYTFFGVESILVFTRNIRPTEHEIEQYQIANLQRVLAL